MTDCIPIRAGTSQKILCAAHCYAGDPEDRIRKLEQRVEFLEKQSHEQRSRLLTYRWIEEALNRGKLADAVAAQTYWLQEKIWKQRRAINNLQRTRRGWDPELIIQAEEPEYLLIQEDPGPEDNIIQEVA